MVHYPAGTTVLHEGDPSDRIVAVCRGSIRLLCYNDQGNARTLMTGRSGEMIGLSSLLAGRPFPYCAETTEPSVVRLVPGKAFLAQLDRDPALWKLIASREAQALHHVFDEMKRSPYRRLLRLLLAAGGPLNMTEQQLGETIGVSDRSVRRHLSRLKADGLVARGRRGWRLLDRPRLIHLLESRTS